ncbi:MAG: glycosyltransferase family A protein [Azonexus sp.]|nr:glycosyltransferase family A protein [Azonexus sp.]
MKASLILATLGRTDDVGQVIRSLAAQSDRRFELIVVDQNPDDRLQPYLQEGMRAGLDLKHLRLDRPSLSGARNLGLSIASGEIVAFPDDDCWYEPDTIKNMLATFEVTPSLDGVIGHWVEQAAAQNRIPKSELLSNADWRCFRGGNASSITLFIKRKLLTELGGFDERFGVGQWYGAAEETDFILRALASGARLQSTPDVCVHHRFSTLPAIRLLEECRNARKRARGTGGIYAKHRLDVWVVVRGLFAPFVTPLFKADLRSAFRGFFVSLGRAEGMTAWRRKETI